MQQIITPSDVANLQRLDRVRLASGQVLIVTGYHPNRPSNCWSGVLENGKGKGYVFGRKHRPVKLGVVAESHPALVANQDRGVRTGRVNEMVTGGDRLIVSHLLRALAANDQKEVVVLAEVLRANGF